MNKGIKMPTVAKKNAVRWAFLYFLFIESVGRVWAEVPVRSG